MTPAGATLDHVGPAIDASMRRSALSPDSDVERDGGGGFSDLLGKLGAGAADDAAANPQVRSLQPSMAAVEGGRGAVAEIADDPLAAALQAAAKGSSSQAPAVDDPWRPDPEATGAAAIVPAIGSPEAVAVLSALVDPNSQPLPKPPGGADAKPLADGAPGPLMPQPSDEPATPVELPHARQKVQVVHQETHFAPVGTSDFASELAGRAGGMGAAVGAAGRPNGVAGKPATANITNAPEGSVEAAPADGDSATAGLEMPRIVPNKERPLRPEVVRPADGVVEGAGRGENAAALGEVAAHNEASSSAVQQISNRVVRELQTSLGEPASIRPAADAGHALAGKPAPGSVLRVLHIQLQPADLGTVTVRMSLKNNELELHVEAARADTARLIEKDRQMLESVVRSAGYAPEGVTVHIAEPDRTAGLSGPSNASSAFGQSMSSFHSGSSAPEGRGHGERAPFGRGGQGESDGGGSGVRGRDSEDTRRVQGALYL
jgi:chemotaxis protein MotD